MSSPFNDILIKAEDATEAILLDASIAIPIYKGGDNQELPLPRISIVATDATERTRQTGNFTVKVDVEIRTSMDDYTIAQRRTASAQVADALSSDNLAVELSNTITDFKVFGALFNRHSQRVEERSHIYAIEIELHCYTVSNS